MEDLDVVTILTEHGDNFRCKQCNVEKVSRWRKSLKGKLIQLLGGKCELCGYDKCNSALHFHHFDPTTKSFGLSQKGLTRSRKKVETEIKKCVLLCANCHAEVEEGMITIPASIASRFL